MLDLDIKNKIANNKASVRNNLNCKKRINIEINEITEKTVNNYTLPTLTGLRTRNKSIYSLVNKTSVERILDEDYAEMQLGLRES